jgi:hypothetical protein
MEVVIVILVVGLLLSVYLPRTECRRCGSKLDEYGLCTYDFSH